MQGRGHRHGWGQSGFSRRAVRFLEPTLLLLLHHGPAHGYTLLSEMEAYGLEEIDPSAVYRALREMEERGWVVSSWEEERTQGPPRRVYRLTSSGNEVLGWWMTDLRQTAEIIGHLLTSFSRHMEEGGGDYH